MAKDTFWALWDVTKDRLAVNPWGLELLHTKKEVQNVIDHCEH